jgi:Neprosin
MLNAQRPMVALLVMGIVAGMLGAFLNAPPARASGVGMPYQWLAGGYQPYAGLGVSADVVTYAPAVSGVAQSLARIAAVSPDGTQAIEAGWIVAPWFYPDSQPHLFVHCRGKILASDDTYWEFWGDCPWRQVSETVAPGMALTPGTSHVFQLLYRVYVNQPGWGLWLDSGFVGYIPATAWSPSFTTMARAEWYGEVDTGPVAGSSCTDMGNSLYGTQAGAAHMAWLAVQDWSWNWHSATATSSVTAPRLYNINEGAFTFSAFTGVGFAYGGPGAC